MNECKWSQYHTNREENIDLISIKRSDVIWHMIQTFRYNYNHCQTSHSSSCAVCFKRHLLTFFCLNYPAHLGCDVDDATLYNLGVRQLPTIHQINPKNYIYESSCSRFAQLTLICPRTASFSLSFSSAVFMMLSSMSRT